MNEPEPEPAPEPGEHRTWSSSHRAFTPSEAAAVALAISIATWTLPASAREAAPPVVREPAVAGQFYPADAGALRAAVRGYLEKAAAPAGVHPVAVVAPHAGYVFSGQVAADAWRQAQGQPVDLIVILGTNHTAAGFRKVALLPGDGLRTPLGVARLDAEVGRALLKADPDVVLDSNPHLREHSVEVQVPFAQVLFPEARIVALVIGDADPAMCERLGAALAAVLRGKRALLVASSDLSHYPAAKDAAAVDGRVLDALLTMDARRFRSTVAGEMARGVRGLVTCACGEAPILAALAAARALGATRATLVRHATSADVPGGPADQAVGYGAVSFDAGEIDPQARAALLARAREAIAAFLATGKPPPPRALPGAASLTRGVFVTLTKGGELRGCIGRMSAAEPLAATVTSMAIAAAVEDPRFPPVGKGELSGLRVEVSVLTPSHPVPGPDAVVVGRDGVLLSKAGRSAVFLPQVAPEQGWNRDQLLDHLCEKAGLPTTCWREGAALSVFQAEVFGEERQK